MNTNAAYAEAVATRIGQRPFAAIADTTHPTDSHPPLSARPQALKLTIDDLTEAASEIAPTDAAIALVANHEDHERQISQAYQHLLAQHVGIDLKAAAGNSHSAAPLEG